jgi:hypothetical protein
MQQYVLLSLPRGVTARWKRMLNCLKLQKRLMFGRATFDLLRLRTLTLFGVTTRK